MRKFEIPNSYRSAFISELKKIRKENDPRKQDFLPAEINFGKVTLIIPRHFGFCYGVENAIEIAYNAIADNPGKRIFLLSEMIHNPEVNGDLLALGVRFIFESSGKQIIPWEEIGASDIVLIPAFGTTVEIENKLKEIGTPIERYDTTCPFVEKVWNRSYKLGEEDFTVVIHGKAKHEETKATFSHSSLNAESIIVRNINEARIIADYILDKIDREKFESVFTGKYSDNFDPDIHLERIGVVNQTTMLSSETSAISELLKETMIKKFGFENYLSHFADTRDTLCYATNDNQQSAIALLDKEIDAAFVIGGYNSSNTTHLVELLEEKFPVYFISGEKKLISENEIIHFDIHLKKEIPSKNYLSKSGNIKIAVTGGASCPDAAVDRVIFKLLSFYNIENPETVIKDYLIGVTR